VQPELPSGDTKSSHRTEEIFAPNILVKDSSKNRKRVTGVDQSGEVSPALAASLASTDYRSLLPSNRAPGWPDIVDASAIACRWHHVSQPSWAEACERLGRERAALCVLVIDRNARLPSDHRYRARSGRKCLSGLLRNASSLLPMIKAAKGYPEGILPDGQFEPEVSAPRTGHSFAGACLSALAKLSGEMQP